MIEIKKNSITFHNILFINIQFWHL